MKSFRKIVSVLLCALMLCCVFVPAVGAVEKYSKGDVDGNGSITAADARLALRASVNLDKLSLKAMKAADVNEDDYITAADARTILRVSVGLESFGNQPAVPGKMPATTEEICNFYKNGVDRIKNGEAGYTKKEWQNVDRINVGSSAVNAAVSSVLRNFMISENEVAHQKSFKGSEEAKSRIAAWTLEDISQVAAAKCEKNGNNYKITIVMKDEKNPERGKSVLGQVTNAIVYWDDLKYTLDNDPSIQRVLTSYENIFIVYRGFTIEAEMTPDGRFVSIDHTADVDINIGKAIIMNSMSIENKDGHMWNYCKYFDFKY